MSGLREALERLAAEWDERDTPGLALPENQEWAKGVDSGYGVAASELRDLLAAYPAEPDLAADRDRIVSEFIAQREEYVRVLKQCVEADADYHRWQGHAEARRQLRDKLATAEAGPVASRERVAEVLAKHYSEAQPNSDWMACANVGCDAPMDTIEEVAAHQADALLAAGVFRDEEAQGPVIADSPILRQAEHIDRHLRNGGAAL